MAGAHKNMMGMGMNYAGLAGEEQKEETKEGAADFEYYEEDEEVVSDDERYEPCCQLTDEHKETVKAWLADKDMWKKMKGLGRGFEGGAKFVPILGDGNCLFSSVSTAMTFSKENPFGTPDKHNEIRQKACDWIVKEKDSKLLSGIFARRNVPFKTDADFDAYIVKKRSTNGMRYTWSDAATANAVAATCGKGPILQCIYPKYINGKACPELPPKF